MIMKSEYTKKAEQLMKTLNITYTIEYDGIGINPNRNDKDKRTMYSVHLENSRGSMDFTFWGSILEAELRKMSMDDYCRIYMRSSAVFFPSIKSSPIPSNDSLTISSYTSLTSPKYV